MSAWKRPETPGQRQERLYREAAENADRHLTAAADRHPCCWERADGPHHPVCRNHVEEEAPAVLPGQESLA